MVPDRRGGEWHRISFPVQRGEWDVATSKWSEVLAFHKMAELQLHLKTSKGNGPRYFSLELARVARWGTFSMIWQDVAEWHNFECPVATWTLGKKPVTEPCLYTWHWSNGQLWLVVLAHLISDQKAKPAVDETSTAIKDIGGVIGSLSTTRVRRCCESLPMIIRAWIQKGELEENSTSWGACWAERSSGPPRLGSSHPIQWSGRFYLASWKLILKTGVLIEDAVLGQTAGEKQRKRSKKSNLLQETYVWHSL